ncbi:MAG: biotin transporter BioY [Clostridia bacterium]|nr:biotin transporter BioY [Clostridia bacterium]
MNYKRIKGKHLAFCALSCALISVGAKIQIPIFTTPLTLQMPAMLLCVFILPNFLSTATIAVYIFAGLLGLPVFASGGGFSYVLNPSFGYLIGFLLSSVIISLLKAKKNYKNQFIYGILVILVVHTVAVFYTYFISNFYIHNGLSLWQALVYTSFVFLPTDMVWCFICSALSRRILKAINL